jgi:hypothetical protein
MNISVVVANSKPIINFDVRDAITFLCEPFNQVIIKKHSQNGLASNDEMNTTFKENLRDDLLSDKVSNDEAIDDEVIDDEINTTSNYKEDLCDYLQDHDKVYSATINQKNKYQLYNYITTSAINYINLDHTLIFNDPITNFTQAIEASIIETYKTKLMLLFNQTINEIKSNYKLLSNQYPEVNNFISNFNLINQIDSSLFFTLKDKYYNALSLDLVTYKLTNNENINILNYPVITENKKFITTHKELSSNIKTVTYDLLQYIPLGHDVIYSGGSLFDIATNNLDDNHLFTDLDIFAVKTVDKNALISTIIQNLVAARKICYCFNKDAIHYIFIEGVPRMIQLIFTNFYNAEDIINSFDSSHVKMYYDGYCLYANNECIRGLLENQSYFNGSRILRLYKIAMRGLYINKEKYAVKCLNTFKNEFESIYSSRNCEITKCVEVFTGEIYYNDIKKDESVVDYENKRNFTDVRNVEALIKLYKFDIDYLTVFARYVRTKELETYISRPIPNCSIGVLNVVNLNRKQTFKKVNNNLNYCNLNYSVMVAGTIKYVVPINDGQMWSFYKDKKYIPIIITIRKTPNNDKSITNLTNIVRAAHDENNGGNCKSCKVKKGNIKCKICKYYKTSHIMDNIIKNEDEQYEHANKGFYDIRVTVRNENYCKYKIGDEIKLDCQTICVIDLGNRYIFILRNFGN